MSDFYAIIVTTSSIMALKASDGVSRMDPHILFQISFITLS